MGFFSAFLKGPFLVSEDVKTAIGNLSLRGDAIKEKVNGVVQIGSAKSIMYQYVALLIKVLYVLV